MSQTIDVSGLPEAVVNDLQRLVETLKSAAIAPESPSRTETAEEWISRLREWAESHPKREIVIDDSRETIYEGRGE
jgi:hypothetical protein